jgi:rhomboid protease GluP
MKRITPEEMKRQIEEYQEKKARRTRLEAEFLGNRRIPVVIVIILVINTLMLVIMEVSGGSRQLPVLYRFGGQVNRAVLAGQYWRLFTPMFLHIGFMHFLFNSLALIYFGRIVELMYGRARFLAIYLISGYFGNILFLAFGSPNVISAGASGAIFGVIGAHIPLNRQLRQSRMFTSLRHAVAGIGYVVWIFFWSMGPMVNVLAHLGGILSGIVLGFVLSRELPSLERSEEPETPLFRESQPGWGIRVAGIAGVIAVLTVTGFLMAAKKSPSYGSLMEFNGGQLFYTSSVTKDETVRLGEYLVEADLFDGKPKTAQIDKSGDTYKFRVIAMEGAERNPFFMVAFQQIGANLSENVFDGAPVEIHICDNDFKTVKVLKPSSGDDAQGLVVTLLEAAVNSEPGNARAHFNLANAYGTQGRYDKAIAEYRETIRIKPDFAEAYANLAAAYDQKGMFDRAIAEYRRALQYDPDSAWVLNNLAWDYVVTDTNLDEAVSLAEKSIQLRPDSTATLHTLGNAYWKTGRNQPALDTFQKLLEIEQGSSSVWHIISDIARSRIEPGIFLDFCSDVETIAPKLELQLVIGDFYQSRGDVTKAQKAFEEARKEYTSLGFPEESNWSIIGPFDNPDGKGLGVAYPPEELIDLSASYPGKVGHVTWRKAEDGRMDGKLNFTQLPEPHGWVVAYALIEVMSPEEREVQLRLGSDDGVKVWLNGEVVWTKEILRGLDLDDDIVSVKLRPEANRLLLKVAQGTGEWELIFRITDETGEPFRDLQYPSHHTRSPERP